MTTVTRPLSAAEFRAFRLVRLVAAEMMPYFMHALFAASPVAEPGLGTFAVDRYWRLYMDPARLDGPHAWTSREAAAVLLHEVGHLIRDHAGRADALPQPVQPTLWNVCGDAEINDDLLAAGAPLPEGVITPAAIGQPDADLAETYYAELSSPAVAARNIQALDDGGPGCGSGAGTPQGSWESSAPIPGSSEDGAGITAEEGDLVRRRVATAVQEHGNAKGRGTVPAGLQRWAERTLSAPQIRWERVLRAAVRRAVAAASGRTDYTYTRPSRRRVPRIIKPAMRGPAVAVSIVIDTSGSMSDADLRAAMGEISGVMRSAGVARDRLTVLACDAESGRPQRVRSIDAITLTGGGGTDMRVGIAAAESLTPTPHVVIVLTDGGTPWPDHPTKARLICGIIAATPPASGSTPPWATTIHISP